MTFTEEWFSPAACRALTELADRTTGVTGDVIEIGCWEGRSTIALAEAVAPVVVHAVDTWEGSPGEISADIAGQRDVFATFTSNTAHLDNVVPYVMGWREFADNYTGTIRLLHIDAEHTYQEVADTIDRFWPHIAPGGIICGDDAHHPPIVRAVTERFPNWEQNVNEWWYQKPVETTLADEYQRLCNTPSDIFLHLPRFVDMVTTLDAQHVIELGTRTGVSTVAWLHGLEQTGGRLTSIDIDEKPDIADHDQWEFIQGDDLDPTIVSSLEPAEIVFIDTSHLYEQTLAELGVYRWLVKPGGVIVLHDTELALPETAPADHPRYPVKKAVREFCEREGYEWVSIPECWGLGIVKVT